MSFTQKSTAGNFISAKS